MVKQFSCRLMAAIAVYAVVAGDLGMDILSPHLSRVIVGQVPVLHSQMQSSQGSCGFGSAG